MHEQYLNWCTPFLSVSLWFAKVKDDASLVRSQSTVLMIIALAGDNPFSHYFVNKKCCTLKKNHNHEALANLLL